jgi:hypothetical protein
MDDRPKPGSSWPSGVRHVALVAAAAVFIVLGLQAVSAFVPGVGDFLALGPVIIAVLVVVTTIVLIGALRPRRDKS